ncbi:MAG: SDR family NAD(P)-dependent oxidoreductase [Bacteroidetes bacterium]|nr:SDR family NAD(P)-dependent oxidoreductase [Fibrella sp.]
MNKQTVLITGASSGIGMATALLLNQKGYRVYAAARQVEKMQHLAQAGIHVVAIDVTKEESMVAAIERINNETGGVDVLVNNAGYGSYGAVEDVLISEARYQFEVNIFGMARLIQLVLPRMREKRAGRIINISSIGGKIGEPHGAWYHATKFAVEGLSDSLRMELRQFNIDVVVIQPGAIKTEWNRIARENLIKVSGHTVYKDLAHKHAGMLANADARGSEPEGIADAIAKAITARKPKTRYAAGMGATLILTLRKILSDRAFDRLILSQMK